MGKYTHSRSAVLTCEGNHTQCFGAVLTPVKKKFWCLITICCWLIAHCVWWLTTDDGMMTTRWRHNRAHIWQAPTASYVAVVASRRWQLPGEFKRKRESLIMSCALICRHKKTCVTQRLVFSCDLVLATVMKCYSEIKKPIQKSRITWIIVSHRVINDRAQVHGCSQAMPLLHYEHEFKFKHGSAAWY